MYYQRYFVGFTATFFVTGCFLSIPTVISEPKVLRIQSAGRQRFKDNGESQTDQISPRITERSLTHQNQKRLEQLRQYYSRYLNIESFYQPQSNKTMIYSCRSKCAGWGDRVRGIMSVYMLALLSQRRFMIDMDTPSPISHILEPNLVNWTFISFNNTPNSNRTQLDLRLMAFESRNETKRKLKMFATKDFISTWQLYDDVFITTNVELINKLLKNRFINSSWLLQRLPKRLASQKQLFALMFELLFKPTDIIVQGVNSILHQSYRSLICLHIRMGRNPSNPFDARYPDRDNLPSKMIKFLEERKEDLVLNGSNIFVAADSAAAINEIQKAFPKETITIPGPIAHIDKIVQKRKSIIPPVADFKTGFVKVMTEFYVMGECDVSILSESGFSFWATQRRFPSSKIAHIFP